MSKSPFELPNFKYGLYGTGAKKKRKKKRIKLTPKERLYVWEHPRKYGRTCNICGKRITKQSDLELDHTKAYSKGGSKLNLTHRDCNRMKSGGSLKKIQKALALKTKKRAKKSKPKKSKPTKKKAKSKIVKKKRTVKKTKLKKTAKKTKKRKKYIDDYLSIKPIKKSIRF